MSLALDVRGLSAGYGPLRVVHDVSLAVNSGERVAILGLNGHGKTTLLRAIVGLVDWRHGQIEMGGRRIDRLRTFAVARAGVVLIPQGDALFPGLSVRDNLDSGAYATQPWRQRELRRKEILELFPQLRSRLNQAAGTLSGGERRMVSIGRGLMADGDVYLVDEPSIGLAHGLAIGMMEKLSQVNLEGGALLVAEQNEALIQGRIDRVIRMHAGRVSDDKLHGSPEPAAGAKKGEK